MYTVDYFINKFQIIPENKWVVGDWGFNGSHCANGHCGVASNICTHGTVQSRALAKLFQLIRLTTIGGHSFYAYHWSRVAVVNDGQTNEYQQPTPKQRILAALYDIKKMQQPQYPDIRKQLAEGIEIGDKTDLPVEVLFK